MHTLAVLIVTLTIGLTVLPVLGRLFMFVLKEDVDDNARYHQALFYGALLMFIILVISIVLAILFWAFSTVFFNAI